MKISGKDLIECIAERLDNENIRCYDSKIVRKLKKLTFAELNQIISFGNVIQWHNDKINKKVKP